MDIHRVADNFQCISKASTAAEQRDFFYRQLPALLLILLDKHHIQYLSNGDLLITCRLLKDVFSPLHIVTPFLPHVGRQKPYLC